MNWSVTIAILLTSLGSTVAGTTGPASAADLFRGTNIWNIHLQFTAEQWETMEPKGGSGPFGGPGGPGGGPGGFGPAMFLAPTFLKGDLDHDGKLSRDEFRTLGETWFTTWDKQHSGKLTADQLRTGLGSAFQPPAFGPPGGGSPMQGAAGRRNGMAAASGVDFKYVHADLEFGGMSFKSVGVRYKGNNTFMVSRNSLKRPMKIDMNKYVKGQKLAGLSQLNLHNNVNDPSWMNEPLSYRLFRDAGVPSPRTAYARVYITVPGKYERKYFGLYSVVEDVDNHFAEDRFGSRKGALFKPVARNLFEYQGEDWNRYNQAYDPKTSLTESQKRRVIEFAKLVTEASDADFSAKLGDYLELDEFARFMAVTVWLVNLDSLLAMSQNYYVYLHPGTQRFQFLPWDLDHSFGQFPMAGSQEQREQLSLQRPWSGENRFLERVFKVEAFQKLYRARLTELSQTLCKPERFVQQMDQVADVIRPAVSEESATKLTRFNQVLAGQSAAVGDFGGPPRDMGPSPSARTNAPFRGGPGGFGFGEPGVKPIKPFATARAQAVLDQLAGKSEGQKLSGPGGPGGRGGPGGPGGRGGPPGPGGFGPAMFLGPAFTESMDADKDGVLTASEFSAGFMRWFEKWNTDKSGLLTEEQLRVGINRDLAPSRGGPPGGPPFGPGDGPPPF